MTCYPPLSDEERATLQGYLRDAEKAYHTLRIGGSVASFTDQNGERVEYRAANRNDLFVYISQLRARLGLAPLCGMVGTPIGVIL